MKAFVTGGSGFVGRNLIAALAKRGDTVRALARSGKSAEAVRSAGAEPVTGELDDVAALRRGMAGCDVVFHSAAIVTDWGDPKEFWRVNVDGTQAVVDAARAAAVPRLVHVSTEAVLLGGPPLHDADETWSYPEKPAGLYPITKGEAERRVLDADSAALATVVLRPALVWGKGDTSVLPQILEAIRRGRFLWVGDGLFKKATTHVRNVVHAMLLAAEKGQGVYFASDGTPVVLKPFLTAMIQSAGMQPGTRHVPHAIAFAGAQASEALWRLLGRFDPPPLRTTALHLLGETITIRDAKIRHELGYCEVITPAQGLEAMGAKSPDGWKTLLAS